jgi:hypothetical protein
MVTSNQIKIIHTLTSLLRVSDETYHRILKNYGVNSSKSLSFSQADELIQTLEHVAVKDGVWNRKEYSEKHERLVNRPGMATPAQLRMVEGLWADLYPETDRKREAALRTYLFRFFKVSDPRFLDIETVNKVIHALKQMKARKEGTAKTAPESILGPTTDNTSGVAENAKINKS